MEDMWQGVIVLGNFYIMIIKKMCELICLLKEKNYFGIGDVPPLQHYIGGGMDLKYLYWSSTIYDM
jgi:hypothetical protein